MEPEEESVNFIRVGAEEDSYCFTTQTDSQGRGPVILIPVTQDYLASDWSTRAIAPLPLAHLSLSRVVSDISGDNGHSCHASRDFVTGNVTREVTLLISSPP